MPTDTPDSEDTTTFTKKQAFFQTPYGQKYDVRTTVMHIPIPFHLLNLIGLRQKPPAEGHWKLPGGWNHWQKLLIEGKMSIEYYTIYALEKSPSLGETFQKKIRTLPSFCPWWDSTVSNLWPSRRRRRAPGQAGGRASRITWHGAEMASRNDKFGWYMLWAGPDHTDIIHTSYRHTWMVHEW